MLRTFRLQIRRQSPKTYGCLNDFGLLLGMSKVTLVYLKEQLKCPAEEILLHGQSLI